MNDNLPKISVIVPAYNAEEYLETTLRSICNQTYTNLEIIVVDDGSTDRTSDVIKKLMREDIRIVTAYHENQGQDPTRNKGISLATGDFIGFVDADDEIEPNMYERLINNAILHDADISHCGISFCWPDASTVNHYETGKTKLQSTKQGIIDLLKGKIMEPHLGNKLFKAHLLENSTPDTTIRNNEDLLRNFIAFSRSKKSIFEDFCGYKYNQREGSFSKNKERLLAATKDILKARKIIVDMSDDSIRPHALRLLIGTYIGILKEEYCNRNTYPEDFISEIKAEFTKHKHHYKYLSFTQQVAAFIISYTPTALKTIYAIYSKFKGY